SVTLVLKAFEEGNSGDIMVQKAPACTVGDLAKALLEIFQAKNPIRILGSRHGEKLYETLCSREEMAKAQDLGRYYKIPPDLRDMNYSRYSSTTLDDDGMVSEYNSSNTTMLSHEEIIATLLAQPYVQEQL